MLCIASYRQVHNTNCCPVCGVQSRRVLVWPRWIESREHKRKILQLTELANKLDGLDDLVGPNGERKITIRGGMSEAMQIMVEHSSVRFFFFGGCVCFVFTMLMDVCLHLLDNLT